MASYTIDYYVGARHEHIVNGTDTQLLPDGIRGFGVPRISIPMQRAPYMDGANLLGSLPTEYAGMLINQKTWPTPVPYLAPREISLGIQCKYAALTTFLTALKGFATNMSPYVPVTQGQPGQLFITHPGGTVYYIEAWLTEISDPVFDNFRGAAKIIVSFICPTPFFHTLFGTSGEKTVMDANPDAITNPGDAPLWPDIWVLGSASTTIVGLHLTNATTGKTWSTSQTMATGVTKWIRVNMLTGEAHYSTDGGSTKSDIISKMDTDAEFWPMPCGANSIQWTSTSGTPSAVTVYHAWNYLTI